MERVSIRKLKHHPDNPRVGNIDAITESLTVNGQYRPVVANRRTTHILAGNHTVKAARRLGWTHVNVAWVDVDDRTEIGILLADNRLSDLATYDEELLTDLLSSMPDLSGTGWTQDAVDELIRTTDTKFDGDGPDRDDTTDDEAPTFRLGPHRGTIDRFEYERWHATEMELGSRKEAVASLRLRLDIPTVDSHAVPRGTELTVTQSPEGGTPIADLFPHPYNPREGDIGAITESLRRYGQYRPIVATIEGIILAGHHVVRAAKALGWTTVNAVFIEANEIDAMRILLADNRTADLATYDDDLLKRTVTTDTSVGWQPDDIQALLEGKPTRLKAPTGKERLHIGEFAWTEPRSTVHTWAMGIDIPRIADAIGIPRTALTGETDD